MSTDHIMDIWSRLWQTSPVDTVWGLLSSSVVCAVLAVVLAVLLAPGLQRRGRGLAGGGGRERGALAAVALLVGTAWLADVVLRGYVFDMSATVSWWRFAVAPVAAAVGLAALGVSLRARGVRRAVDAASATRRTWATFGPRSGIVALGVLAAVTAGIVAVFGAMSTSLEPGVSAHVSFDAPNTALAPVVFPFPGWAYGIPAVCALIVLTAATVFALHRNGIRPFPDAVAPERERSRRAAAARGLVAIALAATLIPLAGLLRMARSAAVTSMTYADSAAVVDLHLPHEDLIVLGGLVAPVLEIGGGVLLALVVVGAIDVVVPGRRRTLRATGVAA